MYQYYIDSQKTVSFMLFNLICFILIMMENGVNIDNSKTI